MNSSKSSKTNIKIDTPDNGLIDRQLRGDDLEAALERAKGLTPVSLSSVSASDLEMIATGAFSPLTGFLGRADYLSVLKNMRLTSGAIWPIPITLPVDKTLAGNIKEEQHITLVHNDRILAIMEVAEKFCYDKKQEAIAVYQTDDEKHPGVARLYNQGDTLLGGDIWLINRPKFDYIPPELSGDIRSINRSQPDYFPPGLRYRTPAETRKIFRGKKWNRIVGFQTRNPIHRGHEYVLRHALEMADGLFIHPLVGETKADDIPVDTRIKCYLALIDHYYPANRILLDFFPAAMRYAGPREAVLHALCRKNYGCSHFIVGRDHAGVGNFYNSTAASEIFDEFSLEELGIEVLLFPDAQYYCPTCRSIVTTKICRHGRNNAYLSGTHIRKIITQGKMPPVEMMWPEVTAVLMRDIRGKEPVTYFLKRTVDVLINDRHSFIPLLKRWFDFRIKKFLLKPEPESNQSGGN